MKSILFVEDEAPFAIGMIDRLQSEGYRVHWTQTGPKGCQLARERLFDLIVLDVMLPGGSSGFDICRELRRSGVSTPILMLTARGEVVDRVVGLKLGADDYVQKNCETVELMARIEALLRRSAREVSADSSRFSLGDVLVDLRNHSVTRDSIVAPLSPVEARLIEYLLRRRGTVVPREALLESVWSLSGDTLSRTVDVHIAGLRKKIEEEPRYPRFLLTVKGVGYKLA